MQKTKARNKQKANDACDRCFAGNFITPSQYRYLALAFAMFVFVACTKEKAKSCSDEPPLHSNADFPIGVAVNTQDLQFHPRYREIVTKQFNSITADNIFKPVYLHPQRNYYDWHEADRLSDYCQNSQKRLHGHTLIWHNQLPQWMHAFEGSSAEWEKIFKEHIQTIVAHFKGKVSGWDVVNEAFNDDGTLRNSLWKQRIGPSYIEKAFIYAHEADPGALLFYNDYDLALNETKRAAVISLLSNLLLRNVPVHGIGLQMHISVQHPENSQIAEALSELSRLGLKVHISELDISTNPLGKKDSADATTLQLQAHKLVKITQLYKSLDPRLRYGITIWGVSDADSWLQSYFNRSDEPLLYDRNLKPKAAYCLFRKAL